MIITKYTLNADTDIGCPDDFLDVKKYANYASFS